MITENQAIRELYAGNVSFNHNGVVYHGDFEQPTEDAIQAKLAELQADYDSKSYARARASQYPSIQDQLDTIYHQGIEGWKAEIKKVKDAHPKPE